MYDMAGRHEAAQQSDGGLNDRGLVKEFDDEWQIDHQPQYVGTVHLAFAVKACNCTKHNGAMRAVLIVKDIEDFLHERLLAAPIGFFDIDSHDCDIIVHGRLLKAARDIGSAERSGKAENNRQQGIEQRLEGSTLLDEQQDFHFER